MSATPWTPGPWKYAGFTDAGNESGWFVEVAKCRRISAEGRTANEADANARLIQHAPDMAEALAAWIEPWNGFDDEQTARRADPATLKRIKATRTLLAHIRGDAP